MGDHDERLAVRPEITSQPADRLDVQVVCWLVEQQQVVVAAQQRGERDPAALAAGEPPGIGVERDVGDQRGDQRAYPRVCGPFVLGQVAKHNLPHRPGKLLRLR